MGRRLAAGLLLGVLAAVSVVPTSAAYGANGSLVSKAAEGSGDGWQVRVRDDCYDDKVSCVYRDTSASGRSDIWAVGDQVDDGTAVAGLLRHWNGAHWAPVQPPVEGTLTSVSSKSARQTWVAGYTAKDGDLRPLTLRWTGTRLEQVPVPAGDDDTTLAAVSVGQGRPWLVGTSSNGDGTYRDLAWRWTGSRWQEVAVPDLSPGAGGLVDIAAVAEDDVWVVGNRGDGERHYVLHWDGSNWSEAKLPEQPGGSHATNIQSVYGRIHVVGGRTTAAEPYRERPFVQRLVHGSWRAAPSPRYDGRLTTVARDGTGGVWFGGNDYSSGTARLDRWDGTSMRRAPGPGGELASLTNVPGTTTLWASGGAGADGEGYHAYVARYAP